MLPPLTNMILRIGTNTVDLAARKECHPASLPKSPSLAYRGAKMQHVAPAREGFLQLVDFTTPWPWTIWILWHPYYFSSTLSTERAADSRMWVNAADINQRLQIAYLGWITNLSADPIPHPICDSRSTLVFSWFPRQGLGSNAAHSFSKSVVCGFVNSSRLLNSTFLAAFPQAATAQPYNRDCVHKCTIPGTNTNCHPLQLVALSRAELCLAFIFTSGYLLFPHTTLLNSTKTARLYLASPPLRESSSVQGAASIASPRVPGPGTS